MATYKAPIRTLKDSILLTLFLLVCMGKILKVTLKHKTPDVTLARSFVIGGGVLIYLNIFGYGIPKGVNPLILNK